jgi:hypothetical protein
MGDRARLGRRRTRSMACWLEGIEILGYFHCRANDHAPSGEIDFECNEHLIALRRVLIQRHFDGK